MLFLCAACGGADELAVDASRSPDAEIAAIDAAPPASDASPNPRVPDPGTAPIPNSWPDTEPNDTPEQAVRLGLVDSSQLGPYIGLFTTGGHLGGGDEADYFVFRTKPGATVMMIAGACWGDLEANLLDFVLYKVVDGEPLITVKSSQSTSKSCETPQPFWNIMLDPDTKYLFGLIHVEGEGRYDA